MGEVVAAFLRPEAVQHVLGRGIASMGEVVAAFLRPEAVQHGADSPPGRLNGAFGRVAEQGFALGADLLNRVEVGGVGRQEAEGGPHPLNGGPHGGTLVAAQIVHNDDIARRDRPAGP